MAKPATVPARRSAKRSITPGERLALVALIHLGQRKNAELRDLEAAALEITAELDKGEPVEPHNGGHTTESMYEKIEPDVAVRRLLKHLDIEVEKPRNKKGKR